jgi:hypothetical protein
MNDDAKSASNDQVFYTDKQLCERWQCSHMKLYRLRKSGKMSPPIKFGGTGPNRTTASEVKRVEAV